MPELVGEGKLSSIGTLTWPVSLQWLGRGT